MKKYSWILAFCLAMVSLPCFAVEQIDLTTPITTPSITYYKITRLTLDIVGQGIIINLKSSTGQPIQVSYNGAEATT